MNYYVVETDKHKLIQKTAGVKARQDVETIFKWNNFKKIEIPCLIEGRENKTRLGKIKAHYDVYMLWKNALKKIKKNDWIYIQFPLLEHTMLFSLLIKNLEKRGIHTSIIIHDVEAIRFTLRNDVPLSRKIRMRFEEISSFKNCSKIIVHNEKMKSFMHEKWKIHKDKMDILGIFDYLVENYNEELLEKRNLSRKGPVIIAGALSKHKAGYIYNLPENCNFNLYGINFEREKASSNTNYVGAFNPEELIYNLQGSFGLVWDGDSSATCTGVYGDYLKINNPHKTSMYLAAGIPVIIWEEAALANFIKKNHCGITIKSILVVNEGTATIDYVPSRNNSRVAKAPQSFWLDDILKAHEKALSEGEKNCIDSCTMMQRYGYDLYLIDGPGENIKITTPEDFYTMRAILEAKENEQIYGLE